MRFDPQRLAELVAREAELTQQVDEMAERLNASHATDSAWDDARLAAYMADQQRHSQITRERDSVRTERMAYELREPARVRRHADDAFTRFLRGGVRALAADELDAMRVPAGEADVSMSPDTVRITLAATRSDEAAGSGSGGGAAVDEDVSPTLVEHLAYYGGVARMATQFMTAAGGDYRMIQTDSAGQVGMILAAQANAASADDMPVLQQTTFGALTSHSNFVDVTREFVQDAVFDVGAWVRRAIIRRIGRVWNRAFTLTQSGQGMPVGVVSAASGAAVAAAQDALTYPEVIDLPYRIDRAYREDGGEMGEGGYGAFRGGMTGYMMSDSMERLLRVMVDGENRPLWVPAMTERQPDRIAGWPYVVNGDMAAVAASSKSLLFGNFSYYAIRTVQAIDVSMFWDSATAATNTYRYIGYARRDGRPIGATAGDPPICEAWAALAMAA